MVSESKTAFGRPNDAKASASSYRAMQPDKLAPLFRSSLFWTPERQISSAWSEHVPFAFWLVDVLRPLTIAELGTYSGVSYSAMCQAVRLLGLPTRCFAIDTWAGDDHTGFYSSDVYREFASFHDSHYSAFSSLIRSSFDEAVNYFDDQSIDLLHIDGLHTYEAVRHDFETWRPKLSKNAVVLLHDTNFRERNFGVFRYWDEIREQFPHFCFLHGHGLGIIAIGDDYPDAFQLLIRPSNDQNMVGSIRQAFSFYGKSARLQCEKFEVGNLIARHVIEQNNLNDSINQRDAKIASIEQAITAHKSAIINLQNALSLRFSKIEALSKIISDLKANTNALNQLIKVRTKESQDLRSQLAERLQRVSSLSSVIETRDHEISQLKLLAADRDQDVADLTLAEKEHNKIILESRNELVSSKLQLSQLDLQLVANRSQVDCLRNEISRIFSSKSWRITAPLRSIRARLRLLRRTIAACVNVTRQVIVTRSLSAARGWRAVRKIRKSGLFDRDWYLSRNRDVDQARLDPIRHYVTHGFKEGRDPHPLFDTDWYLENNPDVAAAGVNPLVHFIVFGAREMRKPNPLFDTQWYLTQNRDVAKSRINPLLHFWQFGAAEGRDPSPCFNTAWYVAQNPDVAASGTNALYHYIAYGRAEGRKPNPPAHDEQNLISCQVNGEITLIGESNSNIKSRFREQLKDELNNFLAGKEKLVFCLPDPPDLSIIIPAFNQAEFTFACLKSIAETLEIPAEIIVIDNASTDLTERLCSTLEGVRIIRNNTNLHFVAAVNQAAQIAKGAFILVLNNDTVVKSGAITAAYALIRREPDIGAVGAKLILPDGSLQEAGSIVWSDGSTIGYGRGRLPTDPEFQFRRDVDYCSGAALMIRRSLFEHLNFLDPIFSPAYYEETDLCMRIRDNGFRVVYEPCMEIIHFEFGSASSPDTPLLLQRENQVHFVEKHRTILARNHHKPGTRLLDARMVDRHVGRILIIDDQPPDPTSGSGFPRALSIVEEIEAAGWFITLLPMTPPNVESWSATYNHLSRYIEIASGYGGAGIGDFIGGRYKYYDAVLVSRPHNMKLFSTALIAHPEFKRDISIIYDAEALFCAREAQAAALRGSGWSDLMYQHRLDDELALVADASFVFAVSGSEAKLFKEKKGSDVYVLGHSLHTKPTTKPFSDRKDILFVGAVEELDSPNVDSIKWFVHSVMPLLDGLIGTDYHFNILGRVSPIVSEELSSDRVRLLGRANDLTSFYSESRLLVAPTRFAAGLPMKVHASAAAGLPVVVTPVLAEQLKWRDGEEVLIADTADSFANACAYLYLNEDIWWKLRVNALNSVTRDCDPSHFSAVIRTVLARAREAAAARTRGGAHALTH